jgi:hypothetical protein
MSQAGLDWRRNAAEFLSGARPAFASTLVAIVLKSYGAGAMNWDPLTRRTQISQDFGVDLGRREYESLEALINAMTTDTVYNSVMVFLRTVAALNRKALDLDETPDADDVAWAVTEVVINDPEPPLAARAESPWGRDIARVVGYVLDSEGVLGEPQCLRFADREHQPLATDASNDVAAFEGAMASSAAHADELDADVARKMAALTQQLELLGIESPKP